MTEGATGEPLASNPSGNCLILGDGDGPPSSLSIIETDRLLPVDEESGISEKEPMFDVDGLLDSGPALKRLRVGAWSTED